MKRGLFGAVAVLVGIFSIGDRTLAQVVSDNTIGTTVNLNGTAFEINNGMRSGNNLFHSFSQFSVPTGGSAIFNNATDVQNIFGRVTGNQVSNIDGILKTQGSTNLFLMNPNGIVFGPNAQLQLGGSFLGTTANSIKFSDGIEFNTVNSAPALLSVNLPIGLQMGQNFGNITVQGTGHRIGPVSNSGAIQFNTTPAGLKVASGKTLALIGGNLQLDGGILTAPGGWLELGAVQPTTPALVGLQSAGNHWIFDYGAIQSFGDIQMQQRALGNISNSTGSTVSGGMQLRARNIILQDGAALVWENRGSQPGTGITLQASDRIQFLRQTSTGFRTGIYADARGSASPGDFTLSTPQLRLQEGTFLVFRTFGSAAGSNVTINAADLQLFNSRTNTNNIMTRALGSGRGGHITVNTQRIAIQGGGSITAVVQSNAQTRGGDLIINARDSIDLISGVNGIPALASLNSITIGGKGDAGNVRLNTGRLVLRNGGAITSSTSGEGKGGTLTINASESIDLAGTRADPLNGFVRSGIGSSGSATNNNAFASLGVTLPPSGNAGTITINTPQVRVADGAVISVANAGSGRAGNLSIHTKRLTLDNDGRVVANTASGEGGNITLNVQDLLSSRHGSLISAEARGIGNGGNIAIDAPVIVGLENSDIIANAVKGKGGNIQITTQSLFGLKYRTALTPENDITASSEFGINGNVQVNTIGINPTNALNALPTEIVDSSRQIADRCGVAKTSSFIATGRGGIPHNPSQKNRTDRVWHDMRAQIASSSVPPVALSNPIELLIEASAIQVDQSGSITLVAPHSIGLPAAATCAMK